MDKILEDIESLGIVPVLILEKEADAIPVAKALISAGLNCAEVCFRTKIAGKCINILSKKFPNLILGAGTVLNKEQVDMALDAGAQFIVSPALNEEIVKYCQELKVPVVPGISSASEVDQATRLGLDLVKFFPAEATGGIKFIKAISSAYPKMKFMPTGGINAENLKNYIEFEKISACGGSWMVSKKLIAAKDFDTIKQEAKNAIQIIQKARTSTQEKELKIIEKTKIEKEDAKLQLSNKKVVTMGEIMLRLSPTGFNRFIQAENFDLVFGGAEANVAVSLANFGVQSSFVTKLPEHEIGQAAINSLRKYGVNTSQIVRGGDRVGIYFLEKGASQRASKVIYDRANSAIAEAKPKDFNWEKIFENADCFHLTGITPALSDNARKICLDACKTAKKMGLIVSCDLNYRKKLWSPKEASKAMTALCKYVDICISNEEDAEKVFGIKSKNSDVQHGKLNKQAYQEVAESLCKKFKFKKVGITLRESISASENNWSAMLYENGESYFSKKYSMQVIDRLGGGDSFAAALICAELEGFSPQEQIEFASAASCLKHSINGDFNQVSYDEVLTLAMGDGSGRVQR